MRRLLDVNVIVGVLRADSDLHEVARTWFMSTAGSTAPILVLPETLAAAVRILTNDRIWTQTSTTREATLAVDDLIEGARLQVVGSSPSAWSQFQALVTSLSLRHRDVPDALLAAQARALGAQLVTFDRGFQAYPDLDVQVL